MLAMPGIGQLSVSLPCRNIRNTGPAVPMLVFCLLDMHARVNVQTQQNSRREKKKTHETPQKIHSGTLRACALRQVDREFVCFKKTTLETIFFEF